ncbi:MAG: hypothetical protein RLZ98_1020 [Pseudomonadota bacterium]|jgi:pimeloyl-ACP methyl ester carboxylesterase
MQESTLDVYGQKLRLVEAGTGPTILFLHGAGGANWSPLHDKLAGSHRLIAPEHPGFGKSPTPEWMLSVGDLAFFYLDLLKLLDLRDVHLVGHSLGGWTAAEIAIRSTERICSVTLMAPAGCAVREAAFGDIFLWTPEEAARNQFYNQELAEKRIAALANADLDVVLQNKATTARLAWSPRLHNPQLPQWLHRIDRPTRLVWGLEDKIIPFACRKPFLEGISDCDVLQIKECGHLLHSEKPGETAEAIAAHIRKVES